MKKGEQQSGEGDTSITAATVSAGASQHPVTVRMVSAW